MRRRVVCGSGLVVHADGADPRGEGQGEEFALRLILRAQRRVFPSNSHRPRNERACSRQCIEPLSPRHGAVAYVRGDTAPGEPRHQLGAAARRRLRPRHPAHRHQGTPIITSPSKRGARKHWTPV